MKFSLRAIVNTPVYLVFAVLYVAVVILRSAAGLGQLAVYLGMDVALVGLMWFVYDLTKKRPSIGVPYRDPGLELAVGLIVVEIGRSVFPSLESLQWWNAGIIIRKNVFNVLLVAVLCHFRRTPLWNWRETKKNVGRDVGLGFAVLLMMAVPAAFYGGTFKQVLSGSLKLTWLPGLFAVAFAKALLLSGLNEEVFYRGFVQARLGAAFENEWRGLVAASLYFGLIHTAGNQSWGYDAGFLGGFTESMFVQTFHGLVFGMLWMRTKSVIPGVILHSGLNAVTNLTAAAQDLGWM